MYSSQLNYFPLALPFFFLLAGFFLVLVILVQVHVLHFAYMRLGISSRAAFFLLVGPTLDSRLHRYRFRLGSFQHPKGEDGQGHDRGGTGVTSLGPSLEAMAA